MFVIMYLLLFLMLLHYILLLFQLWIPLPLLANATVKFAIYPHVYGFNFQDMNLLIDLWKPPTWGKNSTQLNRDLLLDTMNV